MLKNSEHTSKFTENDIARLQKVEARLDNFIKEIDIHAKKLEELKAECQKAENERNYLEDQSVNLNSSISGLNTELSNLHEQITSARTAFQGIEEKSVKINAHLSTQEEILKNREVEVSDREREYERKIVLIQKESEKLETEKVLVAKTLKVFKETIHSITWLS